MVGTFLILCVGAVMLCRIRPVRALGFRLNLWLILLSASLAVLWFGIERYSPPVTIPGQWWMFRISLLGFFCMLVSFTTAIRALNDARSGFVAGSALLLSFVLGIFHFLGMAASIPFS